jgi:hypothetical protein
MSALKTLTLLAATTTMALVFDAPDAIASFVPHGTYAQTCRHIHVDGPYLEASCARADGSWRWTRIFVPRCGGIEISNQNGHLACGE